MNTATNAASQLDPSDTTIAWTTFLNFFLMVVFFVAAILLVCAVFGFFVAMHLFQGIAEGSGPAGTNTSFLSALSTRDYAQAYRTLGPSITIQLSEGDFTHQAQASD